MLGGLLTLATLSLAYALILRTLNAWRYVVFVVVTGASSLMRTGLVETLFPAFPPDLLQLLKVCSGPLSAALVLAYLGVFLGGAQEDPVAHRLSAWSSRAMLLAALTLGMWQWQAPPEDFAQVLQATAYVTVVAVVLGLGISLRSALTGDPLARWVVLAGLCLGAEVLGLWARSLHAQDYGLGTWILTAVCTVAYFLVGSIVVMKRIRQDRQLDRLSRLPVGKDAATGLPTGSVLLAEVAHAIWRTARLKGESTVICLRVNNLYQLPASAGPEVHAQILTALAARIRRAAGFRCVVGLYHPRCFVVVISGYQRRQYVGINVKRLRSLAGQGLTVQGQDGQRYDFWPRLGMGQVQVPSGTADPAAVIHAAEQLALGPASQHEQPEDDIATMPADSLVSPGRPGS